MDQDTPSSARVYDYLLGGAHNFAVDRQVADRLKVVLPGIAESARLNRAFLRRAVLFLISAGVRQFLDLGSGIPTVGNVHEIAQRVDPDAKVVYVDNEPVAIAHSNLLLERNDRTAAIQADFTDPDSILQHPGTRQLLDFEQPVAVLMLTILHFVPDQKDPAGLVARYRDAVASGSYLTISHGTSDVRSGEMAKVIDVMSRTSNPIFPRSREQVVGFFDGFDLLEPGVVSAALWRPDSRDDLADRPERDQVLAGVGRLP